LVVVPLFNINISVRCTSVFHRKQLSTNIMVLRTLLANSNPIEQINIVTGFWACQMQQSCKIFVEMHKKNTTKGAEHRHIYYIRYRT